MPFSQVKTSRRSPFLLVELLIGISLIACIVSLVFGLFAFQAKMAVQCEKTQREILKVAHARARLKDIFSSPVQKQKIIFLTDSSANKTQDILCVFQAGVTHITELSINPVGRLTLEKNNELVMYTWPNPGQYKGLTSPPAFAREVILDEVTSCRYLFFSKEDKKWIDEWVDKNDPPLFVAVTINRKSETLTFRFPVSTGCCKINY